MDNLKWVKNLIRNIEDKRRKLQADERATARYWNCDDYGSIDGFRDAEAWLDRNLAEYALQEIEKYYGVPQG